MHDGSISDTGPQRFGSIGRCFSPAAPPQSIRLQTSEVFPCRGTNATARVHHAFRRHGSDVAARGPSAATGRAGLLGGVPLDLVQRTLRFIEAFEQGLRSLGYRVGENVVIEYRFANGEMERLPALATDLVRLGVDIIVTGFNPITQATMKATTTIPIVMATAIDPVRTGLVASLARPGGNVTGVCRGCGRRDFGQAV